MRTQTGRVMVAAVLGLLLSAPPIAAVAAAQAAQTPPPAAPSQALDQLFNQPVTSLQFDLEGHPISDPLFLTLVPIAVGKPLTQEDVNTAIKRLDSLGRYDDVLPDGTRSAGGVDVVFHLVPRHPINKFEITGETGVPPSDVSRWIRQRFGGVPTGARPEVVGESARQFLDDEGYLSAQVTASTVLSHQPEGATLVLAVNAGPLTTIAKTDVRTSLTSSVLSVDDVISRTHTQVGRPYRRRDIDAALTTLEDQLRARGYYEVQASHVMTPTPDGADVVISVDTGPNVVLNVVPAGSLPGAADDLIPIKRERSADQDLLEDSKARIEAELRKLGYWKATATFTREPQLDGTMLLVTFTITRGPKYVVDRVDLSPGLSLPEASIRERLEIHAEDVFNEQRYQAGRARLQAEYRRLGFYQMTLAPDLAMEIQVLADQSDDTRARVVLHPQIVEGPKGTVTAVTFQFTGEHRVSEADLRQVMRTRAGAPYVEADRDADRQSLLTSYLDGGFRTANVGLQTAFADAGRSVTITVSINEGPQVSIGDIAVVGNERVDPRVIVQESKLVPGQPLGDTALVRAREGLAQMGVFRRIQILQEGQVGGDGKAHVVISVVEAPATTVGFGGGLEAGNYSSATDSVHLEFSPRGFFEIGRRNLGGRNRSINFFMRSGLKSQNAPLPSGDPGAVPFSNRLIEYRVTGTYQERRVLHSDTDALIGFTTEQAHRPTFNYTNRAASAELLHRTSAKVSVSGRYSLGVKKRFNEQIAEDDLPLIDRLYPQVRLSIVSGGVVWDRQDNPLVPTSGTLVTADSDVATRAIGSQVGYVKTFFQASAFRSLDASRRLILAVRGEVGAARGFQVLTDAVDTPLVEDEVPVNRELPASERFYAGGGTTVRGFAQDHLGIPGSTLSPTGVPIGGNGLIVLNAELRRTVAQLLKHNLAGIAFLDAGNVFQHARDIQLTDLRGAVGFGVRYDSPFGPLRFDVGFKLDRFTFANGARESGYALHLSIGEAF